MSSSAKIQSKKLSAPGFRTCCLLANIELFDPQNDDYAHRYGGSAFEDRGLVYSSNAGFLDIAHIRDVMDLTKFYFYSLNKHHNKNDLVKTHPYKGYIDIQKDIPQTDLLETAASIAFDQSLFHEIYTYWDDSLFVNQRTSSFSPEDLMSNLLGTYAGRVAITSGQDFDQEAETALRDILIALDALPLNSTLEGLTKIKALGWTSGGFMTGNTYLQRRNFNFNPVVPWKLTGIPGANDIGIPAAIPLSFSVNIHSSYNIMIFPPYGQSYIGTDIMQSKDISVYIDQVKTHARAEYGPNYDSP